jgi:O-antigen/teichoic acid export membrane protein
VPALHDFADPGLLLAAGAVASANLLFLFTTMRARSKLEFRSQALQTGAAAFAMGAGYALLGGADLLGLALALAGGYAAGAAVGFALDPARPRAAALDPATLRRLVSVGLPLLSAGILFSLLTTADRWILQVWLGQEAVGLYTLAILSFGAAVLGPTVASQISYPEMAHALGRSGDPRALAPLVRRQGARGFLAGAAPAALLALALPPCVGAWLPDYAGGVAAARWVLPGVVAVGSAMGFANFLNSAGHHRTYLAVQALGLATNVAASSAAAWAGLGLAGVAAATSGSLVLYAAVLAAATRRSLARPAS